MEVGPGDLYGSDYSGKSQVLNVVLSAEGGVDGNVTASVRRVYTGNLTPNFSASTQIKRGAIDREPLRREPKPLTISRRAPIG